MLNTKLQTESHLSHALLLLFTTHIGAHIAARSNALLIA